MDVTEEFENRDSFLHYFIITALAGVEITDTVGSVPRIVTMQINGVELNPLAAIKKLEAQFDAMVKEKALERISEITASILNPFEDQVESMSSAVKQLISEKLHGLSGTIGAEE